MNKLNDIDKVFICDWKKKKNQSQLYVFKPLF